jgi:hypothetical protein
MQTLFIWVALIAVAGACYYFFGRTKPVVQPPKMPYVPPRPPAVTPVPPPPPAKPPFAGADKRAPDQAKAEGKAFEKGTLPEEDRRAPRA